ncbi:hypothetical protein [Aestuariirhabdus litorea]|uniref:Uncharacterized protein n=1 Tax=Aestuariirhabdus litorea TaxID=2528527 RepID=A0A3P3VIG1_9GAMM|nr:hypothetical protein [Aestuariirhabdus litorea]RRJ82510.1 hypothetical protein D0544_11605 [Aestuariirhabdus litorea]RWW92671.1 hypothetical protein DZC74_11580 [Endozoicomonadaceae bacterium GTF-13]
MSDNSEIGLEKIQQLNQLLEETLESRSKGQLIQLVRLLGASLGAIRVQQSDEEKQREAHQRVEMTQAVAAGDPQAIAQAQHATVAAITEILSALSALQEPTPGEGEA